MQSGLGNPLLPTFISILAHQVKEPNSCIKDIAQRYRILLKFLLNPIGLFVDGNIGVHNKPKRKGGGQVLRWGL